MIVFFAVAVAAVVDVADGGGDDDGRPRPAWGDAQGGLQRGVLKSLLRGRAARCSPRGGNQPRPGFPVGETGKGESCWFPEAIPSTGPISVSPLFLRIYGYET
jgi:hypothetical protein